MPPSQAAPTRSPTSNRVLPGPAATTSATTSWPGVMSGLLGRQVTFGQVQVGAAHPATADPEQQLAGAGLGHRPLGELERARGHRPGLMDHPRAHGPTVGRLGQARVNRATTEMVAGPRSMPSWFQVMPNWARSISASARTVTADSVTSARVAVKVSGRVMPAAVS